MEVIKSNWANPLLYLVFGFLLFEIISGLSIFLLPFSVSNQILILLHTGVGLLFLFPFLWYQYHHWKEYRSGALNEFVASGYISMLSTLLAIFSGLIITGQALFATYTSVLWKNVHITATFVLLFSICVHVGLIFLKGKNSNNQSNYETNNKNPKAHFAFNSLFILGIQFSLLGLFMFTYSEKDPKKEFPTDFEYYKDSNNPFSPSLAITADSHLIHSEWLGGSASCGTSGCHKQIYEEWETSAHRYSAKDPFFRKIQENMGKQKGVIAARYCAGCHDPIGLFSGSANLYSDQLTNQMGLDEGISCISCHSIESVDIQGNADFSLAAPNRYLFELKDDKTAKVISDFLIRSYPKKHIQNYSKPLFKTAEYCSSCHKQFVDEEINNVGWVQLQNQYDQWRKSHWYSDKNAISTLECRDCHMPLIDSKDPSSGDAWDLNRTPDDGKHRSHRFLGGNQFVPHLLNLPDAEKHIELTEKWLKGEYEIPEIEDKWVSGSAIPIKIISSDSIRADERLQIGILISNKKAGHDFPTGPLDMIQSWVQLTATDQNGVLLFSSGSVDENNFIEPGAFMFKAEPVDQFGNLIDRHNLWELVGVRFSRALFPGHSDLARFSMMPQNESDDLQNADLKNPARYSIEHIPQRTTEIIITARLQYRKVNQFLMNEVFSEIEEYKTAPITTISADTHRVRVFK